MKKAVLLFIVLLIAPVLFAQQKYALVIGNGNYTNFGSLPNALNDANDMIAALQGLGFTVDRVLDGDRAQMEEAITRLKNRLSVSTNSYGFFFYAGHGLQYNGVNYLIPAKADIPRPNYLGDRAVSVQTMLAELNDAGNELNIVVLDACRDFPAAWMRSTNRGLTVVSNQPADSIIVYATSAGSTADDGTGRNGLFTEQLLKQLKTPGLDIKEIFDNTGAAVSQASSRQQIPAIYSQYFGKAYLGSRPSPQPTPAPQPAPTPQGSFTMRGNASQEMQADGLTARHPSLPLNSKAKVTNPRNGKEIEVTIIGRIDPSARRIIDLSPRAFQSLELNPGEQVVLTPTPAVRPTPAPTPAPQPIPDNMVRVEGGTFQMGSNSGENDERPVRAVTVRSFYMGRYEVTQKEWFEIMGTTVRQQRDMGDRSRSLYGEGDNYPMYYVSWLEAVEYCNKRSQREGLTPAYSGSGNNITCDWNANGYRLPTEAEWEYAAKGGNRDTMVYEYSGSNIVDSVAWYNGNSGNSTKPVGTKAPNSLGLYDMSGNVWEWCWDWYWDSYGIYASGTQTDPRGAASGSGRVLRGGGWNNTAQYARSARRGRNTPSNGFSNVGFRLVRNAQ